MAKDFFASVDEWVKKTKDAQKYIFLQSAQDLIEIMQTPKGKGGNMPVDLGFLRSSLRVTLNQPASGFMDREVGNDYKWAEERTYTLTIAGASVTDSIWAVYLANYAVHQEYGTKYMEGNGFRRLAAQQWQQIVAKNVAKAKAKRS